VIRYFGVGLLLGAELVAFVVAVFGALVQQLVPSLVLRAAFLLLGLVVIARELDVVRFRVPENARLVPEWVQQLGELGALQFGFEMGTGMRTYSPSALPHLALLAVLLVVPFPGAFVIAAGFALARLAMPLMSNGYSHDGTWTTLWERAEKVLRPVLAFLAVGAAAGAALIVASA
jgi:hypothetical protein